MKLFTALLCLLALCLPSIACAQVPTPAQLQAITDALGKLSTDTGTANNLQATVNSDATAVNTAQAQLNTDQASLSTTLTTVSADEAALLAAVQALSPQARAALLKALSVPLKAPLLAPTTSRKVATLVPVVRLGRPHILPWRR